MRYKYSENLETIPNCPAAEYSRRSCRAYRFVFQADLEGSFVPVLGKNPKRALKFDDLEKCSGWALSFFTSAASAAAKFQSLQRVNPKIHKALGDTVAEGMVYDADGVSCIPDVEGHFELHEFEEVSFSSRFSPVEVLI